MLCDVCVTKPVTSAIKPNTPNTRAQVRKKLSIILFIDFNFLSFSFYSHSAVLTLIFQLTRFAVCRAVVFTVIKASYRLFLAASIAYLSCHFLCSYYVCTKVQCPCCTSLVLHHYNGSNIFGSCLTAIGSRQ